jgi:hypothetical protein
MVVGAVLLSVPVTSLAVLLNPLRRYSEQELRSSLLETTPLDSSKDQVQDFIDSKGWKTSPGKKDSGLFWLYLTDGGVGESAVSATLGSYQGFPAFVTVRAIWVFDEQRKLVDIQVFKFMESL